MTRHPVTELLTRGLPYIRESGPFRALALLTVDWGSSSRLTGVAAEALTALLVWPGFPVLGVLVFTYHAGKSSDKGDERGLHCFGSVGDGSGLVVLAPGLRGF